MVLGLAMGSVKGVFLSVTAQPQPQPQNLEKGREALKDYFWHDHFDF